MDPAAQTDEAPDPHAFRRRGLLFVLSSPSGAGKSTIARKLLEAEPTLSMSVSYTTRRPRSGEVDGRDYHFVDLDKFRVMVANHEFLEWAHVFNHRYGTPRSDVFHTLGEGRDILFDIDWQGAQQLHQLAGGDVVRVFVLPPSMAELRKRLELRATDAPDIIEARMSRAANEVSHWDGYDYVLVNDDVESCFECVKTILAAERLNRSVPIDAYPAGASDLVVQLCDLIAQARAACGSSVETETRSMARSSSTAERELAAGSGTRAGGPGTPAARGVER